MKQTQTQTESKICSVNINGTWKRGEYTGFSEITNKHHFSFYNGETAALDNLQGVSFPDNKTKFWVTMTDKFMSGWGKAEGKTNKLVIACDNYEQAAAIERNAHKRNEMSRINICSKKPYYRPAVVIVSEKHFTDMGEIWTKP
jgi:hypothetical protein